MLQLRIFRCDSVSAHNITGAFPHVACGFSCKSVLRLPSGSGVHQLGEGGRSSPPSSPTRTPVRHKGGNSRRARHLGESVVLAGPTPGDFSISRTQQRMFASPATTVRYFDHILVPTDGSEGTRGAVEHATDLATTYDAALRILYVFDTNVRANVSVAGTSRLLDGYASSDDPTP